MLGNPGTYANKKRKKPVLKQKKPCDGGEVVKSNPSKRHRDRLNGELDRLMDLLPFSQDVRSRLDKLSVLRLSVGFLRVKSYFRASMKSRSLPFSGVNGQNGTSKVNETLSEGEMLLQALNGFVMVVTADGSVFYASPTIKDYLGFHQSDVVHQSAFDLIHTDDRLMFREQLHFALNPPTDEEQPDTSQASYRPDQLPPENSSFLERSFVCRFRCLLDNSSGFLALKFQGRLKYLHGQRAVSGSSCPSLALFAVAMPVQPPAIVEIRAKLLLFQTKHHLDFTPTGVDSRGKIILGYSEVELCMKGSGYQFIHAADMMYCADNHIRMIKTGESGLTVFRLLTKSNGWIWVKSNAKLIYKGGRPEFIIAYQKALSNAEGEAYLCQRRLQLPFGLTTGEAVLYNTGPTVDISQLNFNSKFSDGAAKPGVPSSLEDCLLKQDDAIYRQPAESPPLPVDEVFTDSGALLSVAGNLWREGSNAPLEQLVVKEEDKRSMAAMLDGLEKMAGSGGDLGEVLQNLEVDDAALVELEDALHFLSQEQNGQDGGDLDAILNSDMFDFLDGVLFKDKDCLGSAPPSCLAAVNRPDLMANAPLATPHLFPNGSCDYQQANGLHPLGVANGGGVSGDFLSSQVYPQKLTHHGPPPTNAALPPLQQLQLDDIFSPSIELPPLAVPPLAIPPSDEASHLPSCQQGTVRNPARLQESNQFLSCVNGAPPHLSGSRSNADNLPPLIPCRDSTPSGSAPCLQERLQFQSWSSKLNGFQTAPSLQTSEHQTLPCGGGSWQPQQQHHQQGALPQQGAPQGQSSCMFEQRFLPGSTGGGVQPNPASSGLSPAPASCYYQWGRSQPVVGTAVISQDNANVSPRNSQRNALNYQQNGGEHSGLFLRQSADVQSFLME